MSDTNTNPTPNPIPTQGDQGTNDGNNNQPAKENFLVRGFKRAKKAVSDGWKEIKSHPVTHGICAALGVTAGGYVAYKVASSMNPIVPETPAVPQLAEPVKEEDEQQTENRVEYVDIPKDDEPVAEEQ
jgi:hypothetical protein